jgi:hypothetical protein
MDDLVDALRPRLEQLAAFFGLEWDLDEAFDIVSDVFAAEPAPPGTKGQWEYFQLVMDELHSDAALPPFDALWRSYTRHPEPLDWDAVLCSFQKGPVELPGDEGVRRRAHRLAADAESRRARPHERRRVDEPTIVIRLHVGSGRDAEQARRVRASFSAWSRHNAQPVSPEVGSIRQATLQKAGRWT